MTYGGQGVSKPGVKKSDHAIIYTGRDAPHETTEEAAVRGEEGMRPGAIRVDVDTKGDKLDVMSRIDFGKPHTIHHNLKVRSFGKVNRDSRTHLIYQFDAVWDRGQNSQGIQRKLQAGNMPLHKKEPDMLKLDGDIWKDAYNSLIAMGYSHDQANEFLKRKG